MKKRCNTCGQFVSVPWLPSLAFALISSFGTVIGGLGAFALLSPLAPGWFVPVSLVGILAVNVPLLWLYYRFVPLVARAA